ncbi:Receptor-type tyrosine-protein phosphatase mu [Geodia barretti]|uniref:Receptor-type tyrosine-protein phosphatase mu n=1 Tax=Geodia barretti TaxID=519541 RepID=A0AA35RGE0_GEOBA|nr:Receptor-type tyrosine-protein phosphatase mu [Geodia barretti]
MLSIVVLGCIIRRKKKIIPKIKAHNPLEHINETDSNQVTTTIPLETVSVGTHASDEGHKSEEAVMSSKSKENAPLPPQYAAEFEDHVARCHSKQDKEFKEQFALIQEYDPDFPKSIGTSQNFRKLNRFGNITVYDYNRVILGSIDGYSDCQRDFINASYIDSCRKRQFIATQGPLPKTVVDFWRMVWQERSQSIVMLANLVEASSVKCHKYWPETGTLSFGPFNVTITGQQILADYTTREFSVQLSESSEPALSVTQFHFTAWPDHGVPDYATSLLAFHKKVKKHHKRGMGPMIVHCSAGVGRTGTLITIDCVLEQLQEEEKVVDIAGVIIHLRTQRMKMVQSLEQYMFIHDAILEAVTCGDTQIDASLFSRRITEMSHRYPQTQLTEYENQFRVLEKVSPKPCEIPRNKALQHPFKNRNDYYLPSDDWGVVLRGDKQDYIHATFVNGYKQKRAFIIAQSPMESTARDFWKMVHDRKCGVIVMLCDLLEDGQV